MGSPTTEPLGQPMNHNEDQVAVILTKGFWLGEYEVTQSEWQRVMQTAVADQGLKSDKAFKLYGTGESFPMYYINHEEASAFYEELTKLELAAGRLAVGWGYRLPTEAQWEYACRGKTTTATSFGNSLNSREEEMVVLSRGLARNTAPIAAVWNDHKTRYRPIQFFQGVSLETMEWQNRCLELYRVVQEKNKQAEKSPVQKAPKGFVYTAVQQIGT